MKNWDIKFNKKFLKSVVKHIFGISALDEMPKIIKQKGPKEAIDYLLTKYRYYKPALVKFLLTLYRYFLKLEAIDLNIEKIPPDKIFIIHCCCWYQPYVEKIKNYFLPSLMAEGNLLMLANHYNVVLLMHVDPYTKNQLENSAVIEKIKQLATIKFIILPNKLLAIPYSKFNYLENFFLKRFNWGGNSKYSLLGILQTHALQLALKNRAFISFMLPDFILSDAFFAHVCEKISNKKVVVGTTFRTDADKVRNEISSFYRDAEKTILSIPATSLTQLQAENIHPAAKRRIVSERTINFSATAQLIFEIPTGFVIRAFHYHPILIDCDKIKHEIVFDYYPIDNSLLNQIVDNDLPYQQQLSVCEMGQSFSWMELSDENIEPDILFIKKTFTHQELLEKVKTMIKQQPAVYDTPLNSYFASISNVVSADKPLNTGDLIKEQEFFAKLDAV